MPPYVAPTVRRWAANDVLFSANTCVTIAARNVLCTNCLFARSKALSALRIQVDAASNRNPAAMRYCAMLLRNYVRAEQQRALTFVANVLQLPSQRTHAAPVPSQMPFSSPSLLIIA